MGSVGSTKEKDRLESFSIIMINKQPLTNKNGTEDVLPVVLIMPANACNPR